jgi:hypothetical protein
VQSRHGVIVGVAVAGREVSLGVMEGVKVLVAGGEGVKVVVAEGEGMRVTLGVDEPAAGGRLGVGDSSASR